MVTEIAKLKTLLAKAQEVERMKYYVTNNKEYDRCQDDACMIALKMIGELKKIGEQVADLYNRNAEIYADFMTISVSYNFE